MPGVLSACNSSTWEPEAGGSRVWDQPGLHSETQSLKPKKRERKEKSKLECAFSTCLGSSCHVLPSPCSCSFRPQLLSSPSYVDWSTSGQAPKAPIEAEVSFILQHCIVLVFYLCFSGSTKMVPFSVFTNVILWIDWRPLTHDCKIISCTLCEFQLNLKPFFPTCRKT
jgi:hypothetical protein